jgi:hypothetical protein
MQYLLLCCFEESRWAGLPQDRRDEIMREYRAVLGDLSSSGHYLAGAKLEPCAAATTLREREGKPIMTDGPYAETKEQLGGYHLVECRDLDEALAIARRIPTLGAGGAIEVRPLAFDSTQHTRRVQ